MDTVLNANEVKFLFVYIHWLKEQLMNNHVPCMINTIAYADTIGVKEEDRAAFFNLFGIVDTFQKTEHSIKFVKRLNKGEE